MSADLDQEIRALLQLADEESPRPSKLNAAIVEPLEGSTQKTFNEDRRLLLPALAVAAVLLVVAGSIFALGGDGDESIRVSENPSEDSAVELGELPSFGLPAVFDRPRNADDVLPDSVAAGVDQQSFQGRDGTMQLDPSRSRHGLESEGINLWLVPEVDDRAVCLYVQRGPEEGVSSSCEELGPNTFFGVLWISQSTRERSVIAGVVFTDQVVDVVDAEFRDGVYLSVGPAQPQSSSAGALPETTYVFSDGTTGTQNEAIGAFVDVCRGLWAGFFSGDRVVNPEDITALRLSAQATRTPEMIQAIEALSNVVNDSDSPLLVSSQAWSEAWPAGIRMCAQAGPFDFDAAVVGAEFGPQPEIELEDRATFVSELGRVPETGGLSGTHLTARQSGDCLLIALSPQFLGQETGTEVEVGCGIGLHELEIETSFGKRLLIGALLPEDASFMILQLGIGQRVAIRPVDGIVVYSTSGDSPSIQAAAFSADGSALDFE